MCRQVIPVTQVMLLQNGWYRHFWRGSQAGAELLRQTSAKSTPQSLPRQARTAWAAEQGLSSHHPWNSVGWTNTCRTAPPCQGQHPWLHVQHTQRTCFLLKDYNQVTILKLDTCDCSSWLDRGSFLAGWAYCHISNQTQQQSSNSETWWRCNGTHGLLPLKGHRAHVPQSILWAICPPLPPSPPLVCPARWQGQTQHSSAHSSPSSPDLSG